MQANYFTVDNDTSYVVGTRVLWILEQFRWLLFSSWKYSTPETVAYHIEVCSFITSH